MVNPNRLDICLNALKAANKKAFITFLTAGYPNLEQFGEILNGFPKAGVDIIEIGMPFSDPMADGPVIQEANIQAFKAGITVPKILDYVRTFRETNKDTPIILMGYYNPIYAYGIMRFLDDAQKAGVDGFIIPDMPPEEDAEFRKPVAKRDMKLIRLAAPTSTNERLDVILKNVSGFLYYVSVAGITGGKSATTGDLKAGLARIKAKSDIPVCVGFGVNTPEQAKETAAIADGVIVGSAIIKKIASHMDDNGKTESGTVESTLTFVSSLAAAIKA